MIERGYLSPKVLLYAGLVAGLAAIVVCSSSGLLAGVIAIMFLPAALYYLIQTIRFPIVAFYGLFVLNYFITSIIRYGNLSGFSVVMDIGLFCTLFAALVFISEQGYYRDLERYQERCRLSDYPFLPPFRIVFLRWVTPPLFSRHGALRGVSYTLGSL